MLKILIEGDSYGLPRFSKISGLVELEYSETYPYQLQYILHKKLGEEILVVNRCRHANTTNTLVTGEFCEIDFLKPDFCIVELGLTDLWPSAGRNVKPLQEELLGKDPWVDAETFYDNIHAFVKYAIEHKSIVIIVGIPMVGSWHLKKHSLLQDRIKTYNQKCLAVSDNKKVVFLDWNRIMSIDCGLPMIGSDGIHSTAYASNLLAEKISEICEKFING